MVDALGSLSPSHPIGSPADKIKVGLFRLKSLLGSLEDLLAAPEVTTLQRLRVSERARGRLVGCMRRVAWEGGRGDCSAAAAQARGR